MAPIKIPKTPPRAYNEDRKASDLLLAHVRNLEKAVGKRAKPAAGRKSMTEGEAAAYIRQLARELHNRTLLPELAAAPRIAKHLAISVPKPKRRQTSQTRRPGRRTRKGGPR